MAAAQLVAEQGGFRIDSRLLRVERLHLRAERGEQCVELLLQHLYLARGIVEQLRRGGAVGHQLLVALLLLSRLGQLLTRGGNLLLGVGFLTLVDGFRGIQLLQVQPQLGGVYQGQLLSGCHHVALVHAESQQCPTLLCRDRHFGGFKGARGVVFLLLRSAGRKEK